MTGMSAAPGAAAIEELAYRRLSFERLRPGQLGAVEALAGGRDVLAVLPTGGGKSAIYELAGLLRAGPTVVVSPLIALQDDQLAHLHVAGLPAIVLNSQQSVTAARARTCGDSVGLWRLRAARSNSPRTGPAGHQPRQNPMTYGNESRLTQEPVLVHIADYLRISG
jgi:hypothetical protein